MMSKIGKWFDELKEFGLKYFIQCHIISHFKDSKYRQEIVLKYLRKYYRPIEVTANQFVDDYTVWVCWWQGENQMPPIVKCCYQSILANANNHRVVLITEQNYQDYVTLPQVVLDKFAKNIFSITALSDIIRVALLSQYGGLWLDATIYLTKQLPATMRDFFSLKQLCKDDSYISGYKWTGYCLGGNNNSKILFAELYNAIVAYWEHNNILIDYFLLDYLLENTYRRNTNVRTLIDNNPYNNPDLYFLCQNLNNPYDTKRFAEICEQTYIHKLSWKCAMTKYTPKGDITYYGFLS